jgi:hypothetical protein
MSLRLRRARTHAEFNPASTMTGHKKVHTITQNSRGPSEAADASRSWARVGPSLKRWRLENDPKPKHAPISKKTAM